MKIFRITTILFTLFLIAACNGEKGHKSNPNNLEVVKGPELPINIQKEAEYASLAQARREASALIDHRIESHPDPLAMVTAPYWTWAGFFNGKEMVHPDRLQGQWIKFNDDFTYTYGYYDDVNGTGRYHYRLDDYALILLDDNEEMQPKEFQLQSNGVAIALIGRHGFTVNNGMQMKLAPNDFRPSREG